MSHLYAVEQRMVALIVFDGIALSLNINPGIGVILAGHTGAVEHVILDYTTTRALFDVNLLCGHIWTDSVVQYLVSVTFVWLTALPVAHLLEGTKRQTFCLRNRIYFSKLILARFKNLVLKAHC